MDNMILHLYKVKLEQEKRKSEDDELVKKIYQLALEENIPERSPTEKLLYKAGDLGYELGFVNGFKTAIKLITESLL